MEEETVLTSEEGRYETGNPAVICYSVSPNEYLTEHAQDICGLYDGFYFVLGDWNRGIIRNIGVGGVGPEDDEWLPLARRNLTALREAGVTENLLGTSFPRDGEWPGAGPLLSDQYTEKMHRHFAALARAAKSAAFRGVSIDVEYPYPRYALDHRAYRYESYTPGDLMAGALRQGQAVMAGVMNEFPEAVVFLLPGSLRSRPIERQFMLGMLEVMAERGAPGGFHLATEYSYSLHDPVTQAAIPRFEDAGIDALLSDSTLDYWRRRCTMAPGIWPLHMVETGGEDYPVRPWAEELAELKEQMKVLRAVTKRYIWSYSGQPVWVLPDEEIQTRYKIRVPNFPHAREVIAGWHRILKDRAPVTEPRMLRLFDTIREFDEGMCDADGLCDAFGTPGRWWVLGPLGNPHTRPDRAAKEALSRPVSETRVYFGRDGAVRWFRWATHDPRGVVECRRLFDYIRTDDASAHFVCWVHSEQAHDAWLNVGWDDGVVIRLGDNAVFDRGSYPPEGHGAVYRNRYQFEECVPVSLPGGAVRLAVTCTNSHGPWQFQLRITDQDGYPLPGVRFTA